MDGKKGDYLGLRKVTTLIPIKNINLSLLLTEKE